MEILKREAVYLWYYFTVQAKQIFPYWILGIAVGSAVSVFFKDRIHRLLHPQGENKSGALGIFAASALGVASPLCMYGTVPVSASLSKCGVRDDRLAAFMMSSVLLNPQLIIYSAALGASALAVRTASCLLCGAAAGFAVRRFCKERPFFDFTGFDEPKTRDVDPNPFFRYLKNLRRNVRATGPYFLAGVILSAVFQRYVPSELTTWLFGGSEAWGVLMAATIGVPLYACGGGTIPLLQAWLGDGMSMGGTAAFMIIGPATKITNLGALKIVLGAKRFALYLGFAALFSLAAGMTVNLLF